MKKLKRSALQLRPYNFILTRYPWIQTTNIRLHRILLFRKRNRFSNCSFSNTISKEKHAPHTEHPENNMVDIMYTNFSWCTWRRTKEFACISDIENVMTTKKNTATRVKYVRITKKTRGLKNCRIEMETSETERPITRINSIVVLVLNICVDINPSSTERINVLHNSYNADRRTQWKVRRTLGQNHFGNAIMLGIM